MKNKRLARRVIRLAGSPFCDDRDTLLAGFQSRGDNQSMRERFCQLLVRAKGSTFFSSNGKVNSAGMGTILPGDCLPAFLSILTIIFVHSNDPRNRWKESFHSFSLYFTEWSCCIRLLAPRVKFEVAAS